MINVTDLRINDRFDLRDTFVPDFANVQRKYKLNQETQSAKMFDSLALYNVVIRLLSRFDR